MSRLQDQRPLQILVAYDGTADATTAVELTAAAFPGAKAMVLSVWEPPIGEADERPEAEGHWQAVLVVPPAQAAEPRPAAVEERAVANGERAVANGERAVANGGLRMQVVPLEDV